MCKHDTLWNSKLWTMMGNTFSWKTGKNKLVKNVMNWILPSPFSIPPCKRIIFHTPLIFSLSISLHLANEMRAKVIIVTLTKALKKCTVHYMFSLCCMPSMSLPRQSGSQIKNNLEQSCSQPANDMYHEQEINLCYESHWDLGVICFYCITPLKLTDAKYFVSLGDRFHTDICEDSLMKVFKVRNKIDRWLC